MSETLRRYANRLLACERLAAAAADPVERAAYEAMAAEFREKIGSASADSALLPDDAAAPATQRPRVAPPRPRRRAPHPQRVMVVDDQPEVARTLSRLAEGAGCQVLTETSGAGAVARFLAFDPDVVVLDLVMPQVDGIDVLEMIRGSGREPRVLLMSGFGDFDLRLADRLRQGCGMRHVTTMAKPIAGSEFLRFLTSPAGG